MQVYQYAIVDHGGKEDVSQILNSGMLLALNQIDAFSKMLEIVGKKDSLDSEHIEFMAKPFIEDSSCETKKEIEKALFKKYLNTDFENFLFRNSTAGWDDYKVNSSFTYYVANPDFEIPKKMYMIDVIALINNDKIL